MRRGCAERAIGALVAAALTCAASGVAAQSAAARQEAIVIRQGQLAPDPDTGLLRAEVAVSGVPSRMRGPVVSRGEDSELARAFLELRRRGLAAGNVGDLYHNRDRGHSNFDLRRFPQVTAIALDETLVAADQDYGLNDRLLFDRPTFGNSSTAIKHGPIWRSLGRLALTRPGAPDRLAALYAANQIYVYPAHRDHVPGQGDLFPAATPFFVMSEGRSGSDQPFLTAIATMLAALRPDVKRLLTERGMLAPTLQMLLRRGLARDDGDEAYLDGAAHPSAFRGEDVEPLRLLRLANAIRAETAPPLARIAVQAEGRPRSRVELFGDALTETLFTTPFAVGRIARGLQRDRRYVLSATDSVDPNDRPLRFRWRVLRGDPARVILRPLDERGERAELTISWHDEVETPGRPELPSRRVDVAVFADNGAELSAPAFFSLLFPPNQKRVYDDDGRLASVDFADPEALERYADPALFPQRDWRDEFVYDAEGRLLGWTRTRADGGTAEFDADGLRIVARDAQGRAAGFERVGYAVESGSDRRMRIVETVIDRIGAAAE